MMLDWYLNKPLGEYINIYVVESKEKYGGVITAFLCYLLKQDFIDAAVSVRREGMRGKVVIARSEKEIISSSGSVWQVVPYTLEMKETIEREDLYKTAIVGLPCQINFLRQIKMLPLVETDFGERINVLIALFCYGTFAQESVLNYIKETYHVDPLTIEEIKISEKTLHIIGKKQVNIPLEEIAQYLRGGCLFCPDYTGSTSDLSVGIVEEKTVVIVRSKEIEEKIRDASVLGYLEVNKADKEIVEKIREKSLKKINRAMKYREQFNTD